MSIILHNIWNFRTTDGRHRKAYVERIFLEKPVLYIYEPLSMIIEGFCFPSIIPKKIV